MADAWTKDMQLFAEMYGTGTERRYSLPPDERSALASQYGVGEELLLRHERAYAAYKAEIAKKVRPATGVEAMLKLRALRQDAEYNEITRELKAAADAIRAALGVPIDDT